MSIPTIRSIAVIDLQPLSCMGVQAYLQNLLPGSQCQIAYTMETIKDMVLAPGLDLMILGLNRESQEVTTCLAEKVLAAGPQLPVILLYEIFDLELLKQFGEHTVTGLIAKENASSELVNCINTVLSGSPFMCEKSSQHVINAFTDNNRQGRKRSKRKVAQTTC